MGRTVSTGYRPLVFIIRNITYSSSSKPIPHSPDRSKTSKPKKSHLPCRNRNRLSIFSRLPRNIIGDSARRSFSTARSPCFSRLQNNRGLGYPCTAAAPYLQHNVIVIKMHADGGRYDNASTDCRHQIRELCTDQLTVCQ